MEQLDRTYLVEGSFNSQEIITNVLLPKGSPINAYKFKEQAYNISKSIGGIHFNAICFFMEEENSHNQLRNGDTYFQNIFKINELLTNPLLGIVPFDSSLNECSITVIHNEYAESLVEDAFNALDSDYTSAQNREPFIRISYKLLIDRQPRILGVSIIKR